MLARAQTVEQTNDGERPLGLLRQDDREGVSALFELSVEVDAKRNASRCEQIALAQIEYDRGAFGLIDCSANVGGGRPNAVAVEGTNNVQH